MSEHRVREALESIHGRCDACKWYDRAGDESGLCKESSPQVAVIMIPQKHMMTGEMSVQPQAICNFPMVPKDCWCGKFQGKISLMGMN